MRRIFYRLERKAEACFGVIASMNKYKIAPHLWFDREAGEASRLYASIFDHSKTTHVSVIKNTPSGDAEIVSFELAGQSFMAISAGPFFKFNPSVSFHVKCATEAEVDVLWAALSEGGRVLMELGKYPWSKRYGWVEDRYGLSWQLIFAGKDFGQKITPVLMFTEAVCGKAEEAVRFYVSVFEGSAVDRVVRYGAGEAPDEEGAVKYAAFRLLGQEFGAMDSAREHGFSFNEAVSFIVSCDTQEEIDYYWEKLSADPKAEQCGWLKDRYGLSWQIVPSVIGKMMGDKDETKRARVTAAFLKMKKFDIAVLKAAYEGK